MQDPNTKKRGEDWIRDQAKLAGRITTRMEDLKLRPIDLADHCGVSVTAVGMWLRGETQNLKLDYLFKVADKLEVEARWLATGAEPRERRDLVQVRDLQRVLPGYLFESVMKQVAPDYQINLAPAIAAADGIAGHHQQTVRERTPDGISVKKDKKRAQ